MRKLSLLILLFLASFNVLAECEIKDDGSTRSMACWYKKSTESEDKKLNVTYQRLIAIFEEKNLPKNKQLLVQTQRAWIKYRDENCELENTVYGGIESISYARCVFEQTSHRSKELEKMLRVYVLD